MTHVFFMRMSSNIRWCDNFTSPGFVLKHAMLPSVAGLSCQNKDQLRLLKQRSVWMSKVISVSTPLVFKNLHLLWLASNKRTNRFDARSDIDGCMKGRNVGHLYRFIVAVKTYIVAGKTFMVVSHFVCYQIYQTILAYYITWILF